MDHFAENAVLAIAGLIFAGLLAGFVWLAQRECVERSPFHVDGGKAIQASGTICTKFRNTWWPEDAVRVDGGADG